MPIPQLTPFPDPPRIYQPEEEFDAKADEMAGHLPILTAEINAIVPQINSTATDITTRHSDVVTKHDEVMTTAQQMQINANELQTAVNSASGSATSAASSASSASASAAALEMASTAEIIAGDIARQVTASALKTALQTGVNYAAKFQGVGIGQGGGGINSNTAAGMQALHANTTGNSNTAAGMQALNSNTTGSSNTAAGMQALYSSTTGSNNTAAGMYALRSNTTGDSNTAAGMQALHANTTGNYNTAAGVQALYANTTGNYNTATGVLALYANTTGNSNTAAGMYAGFSGNYNNAIHLGYEAQATADNECKIGNAALTAIRSSAGFYGAAFTTTSDARLKTDIADINIANALIFAKKIKWRTYTKQAGASARKEVGVIAQELQLITAEIGDFEWLVQSSDGYLTVDYTSLYAILERVNQYRFELLEV